MGYDSDHHHQQHQHPRSSPSSSQTVSLHPHHVFIHPISPQNAKGNHPETSDLDLQHEIDSLGSRARDTWDEDSSRYKLYKLAWWTFRLLIFLLHRPELLRGLVHLMQNPNFVQNDPGIVSAESILCETIHWDSSWVFPSATIIFFSLQNYKQLLAV